MKAAMWVVDDATKLYRYDDGSMSLWWAGVMYDRVTKIEDAVCGELLEQCLKLLGSSPNAMCEVHACDVGPFGDTVSVVLN